MDYSRHKKKECQSMAPLGLAMLATIAKQKSLNVYFVDAESEKMPLQEIIDRVNAFCPDYACINILTPTVGITAKIISGLNCKIIAGGYHATLNAELLLKKYKNLRIIVNGEAEIAFGEILDGKLLKDIKGISYKDGTSIRSNKEQNIILELDSFPIIDRSFIEHELKAHKEASIIVSRGCCYKCNFCSMPIMFKGKIRWISPKNVITEMRYLQKSYGINKFHFLDNLFFIDPDWTREFLSLIYKNKMKIEWRCITRADIIEQMSLQLLSEAKIAGCTKICMGLESGSQSVLDLMNKQLTLEQSKKAIEQCKKAKIKVKAYFIIGYPGETKEDVNKTIQFAKTIKLDDVNFIPLKIYPGTPLYEQNKQINIKYKQIIHLFTNKEKENLTISEERLMKYLQVPSFFKDSALQLIKQAYLKFYS